MKKEDSTKEEEEEEENESETLKVSIPGNLPIEPLSIPTQNSTNGASQLAEDLSILSNLHKFKFDRDDLIDIAIPTHPGVTNAGVTKQASLYIASLNLLQIFDMMDGTKYFSNAHLYLSNKTHTHTHTHTYVLKTKL
jgi:hypothetical protein